MTVIQNVELDCSPTTPIRYKMQSQIVHQQHRLDTKCRVRLFTNNTKLDLRQTQTVYIVARPRLCWQRTSQLFITKLETLYVSNSSALINQQCCAVSFSDKGWSIGESPLSPSVINSLFTLYQECRRMHSTTACSQAFMPLHANITTYICAYTTLAFLNRFPYKLLIPYYAHQYITSYNYNLTVAAAHRKTTTIQQSESVTTPDFAGL